MTDCVLDFLLARHSTPALQLRDPGPDPAQLARLLEAALRVPDHGKLVPWRLLLLRGVDKARFCERLAALRMEVDPQAPPAKLEKERERFLATPLVIAVIARIEENHPKVPAQEQLLSAGCVAYNLLQGAQSLGFGAQWLTGWSCYQPRAAALLGLGGNERLIAYIHIGSATEAVPDRERPSPDRVVSAWKA